LQLFKLERFDVDFSSVPHDEDYQSTDATANDDNLVALILTTRNRSDLRDNESWLVLTLVMKRLAIFGALFLAIAFLISACASRDEITTEEPSAQTGSTVPGERVSNEGAVTPGGPGTSANVHW
jgi:hypothetical protein